MSPLSIPVEPFEPRVGRGTSRPRLRPYWIRSPSPPPLSPGAPAPSTIPTESPHGTPEGSHASLALASLVLSLLGFLGVAAILYAYRFDDLGSYWHGVSTRTEFVIALGLAASPFLLVLVRRVPLAFLVLPVLLIVFLYPLFSPYGIPYSRDPVFNFSFAQAVLAHGHWVPNFDVAGQAVTYSYYPAGAVYNAEFSAFTGVPILSAFNWAFPLFRLFVIPSAVYGIGRQMFGPRPALLGTFLYLGVPSIEFGLPTQQDFGIPFFALVVLGIVLLSTATRHRSALFAITLLFAVTVLLTHHVSGYVLAIWLFALAVLPILLRRRHAYPSALVPYAFLAVFVAWDLYTLFVSYPVIVLQSGLLHANVLSVLHPGMAQTAVPDSGGGFPVYELAWIGLALLGLIVGSVLACRSLLRDRGRPFPGFAVLASLLVGVIALPFVSTGFSFLSLRLMEYIGVVLAPACAWWGIERLPSALQRSVRTLVPSARPRPPPRRSVVVTLTVLAALVIFTGGSLVPVTTRDQFASPSSALIDAPRYVGPDALEAAEWAEAHLNRSHGIWGDELATTTFSGFGHLVVYWNGYPLFNGSGFSRAALAPVRLGDYVAVDAYMTTAYMAPEFNGPATEQPTGALPVADLEKFYNPYYFLVIYENSVFTLFEFVHLPPVT